MSVDLSFYNYTGLRLLKRNTANCYVISSTGSYKFPIVYGNGIKDDKINEDAYTKKSSPYNADFVNHLGNIITSPFIELNQNCTVNSAGLLWQTAESMISNISIEDDPYCKFLQFTVNSIPAINGMAVLYVKDSNDNIMWSWTIWLTTDNLNPLTFTNHDGVNYDLIPEDLCTIWNEDHTASSSPFYQWGRKDPMPPANSASLNIVIPVYDINNNIYSNYGTYGVADDSDAGGTERSVGNSIKLPDKFFLEYSTTNISWNNLSSFNNYWNANETGLDSIESVGIKIKTIYDPCPVGLRVPDCKTFTGFTESGIVVSNVVPEGCNVIGEFNNGWVFKRNSEDTLGNHFMAKGNRSKKSGNLNYFGRYQYCWTNGSQSQYWGYGTLTRATDINPLNYAGKAFAYAIRPCIEEDINKNNIEYLHLFNTVIDYNNYINKYYHEPSVSYIKETDEVKYNLHNE